MIVATKKQLTVGDINEAAVEVTKPKRKRPDRTEALTPHVEPGGMAKMMQQAMTISHWPSIDTNNAEQVKERIDQYHMFCIEQDMKPSVVGMAMALGVDRTTLWKWENGVESNKPAAVRNIIKKGREINELMLVQMMQNNQINTVAAIFLLKNSHEYKDQQDVVITPNTPAEGRDPEEIRRQYRESLPEPNENP